MTSHMRQSRGPWAFAGAALALALAGGCADYKSPRLQVVDTQVLDRTAEGVQLGINLAAENPNTDPLKLIDFKYSVEVDNQTVFQGERAALATLPASGSSTLQLPAVVPGWALQAAASKGGEVQYTVHGRLRYTTPGSIAQALFDVGVRRPRISFDGQGQVAITAP